MAEAFEYAVRKDVRNNPIVREVDADRVREMWTSLFMAALVVITMLFWAWQHFALLRHGYLLEEVQRQRAVEEDTARHLRLEIEQLSAPKRVEALATRDLHLVAPTNADALIIERVVPAEPPAKSVVARR